MDGSREGAVFLEETLLAGITIVTSSAHGNKYEEIKFEARKKRMLQEEGLYILLLAVDFILIFPERFSLKLMNKDIVPTLVGLFFTLMPFWLPSAINPLWSISMRKNILFVLFASHTFFSIYILFLANLSPNLFPGLFMKYIFAVLLFLDWVLMIYQAYQLWPRVKQ